MRLINLALVIAALASVAASNTIKDPQAQLATEAISFTNETVSSPTYTDIKAGSTLIEWSGAVMGSLGVMTVIGLEPSAAVKRIIKQVGFSVGESKQSNVFNAPIKSIVTGLSHGVSLALVSPLGKGAQRRRLPLPASMLSSAALSLFVKPASAAKPDYKALFPTDKEPIPQCTDDNPYDHYKCRMVDGCILTGFLENDPSKLYDDIYAKLRWMGHARYLTIEDVQPKVVTTKDGELLTFRVKFHHDMAYGRGWFEPKLNLKGDDNREYSYTCEWLRNVPCCDPTTLKSVPAPP